VRSTSTRLSLTALLFGTLCLSACSSPIAPDGGDPMGLDADTIADSGPGGSDGGPTAADGGPVDSGTPPGCRTAVFGTSSFGDACFGE
jgi:hypothetical protein